MELKQAKIGVGIVTYKRPKFFETALASVHRELGDIADEVVAYHDGPLVKGYAPNIPHGSKNKGVAHAKNWLLKELIARGCDYLFLMEDDVEIISRMAIVGYLAAHQMTGIPHLNFHGHGDNLRMEPLDYMVNMPVVFWPNAVGAWSFYTREAIETVGYFDEHFRNAYEHVEHSWRIYKDQLDYGFWPDVMGSEKWIKEQPGALEHSSIRDKDGNWQKRIKEALAYWRSKDPECPAVEPNWDYAKGGRPLKY